METLPFFTPEEKKEFFTKYRLLLRNLYSFLEKDDISKMKNLMKQVVAQDCYGRDKNGINGLLRNIDTALIATRSEKNFCTCSSALPSRLQRCHYNR
mgnify:CR=1 FL=1